MNFCLSSRSIGNMQGINEALIRVAKRAIELTKVDFGIPETGGLRTADLQHNLYLQGLSGRDGYNRVSEHQSGNALDFYAYVDGKASWEPEHLAQVACAFFQAAIDFNVRIDWGGLWKSRMDMPHIQLKKS